MMASVTANIASTSTMASMTNITSTRINAHFFNHLMLATLITPIISSFRMGSLTSFASNIMTTFPNISFSIIATLSINFGFRMGTNIAPFRLANISPFIRITFKLRLAAFPKIALTSIKSNITNIALIKINVDLINFHRKLIEIAYF
uniref:Candidate secreted effector n=1 Tax=Meloidogyne incognita TaxID=6306 RepID=A0A914KHT2_MELIC